jgi:hypothetical protein
MDELGLAELRDRYVKKYKHVVKNFYPKGNVFYTVLVMKVS